LFILRGRIKIGLEAQKRKDEIHTFKIKALSGHEYRTKP